MPLISAINKISFKKKTAEATKQKGKKEEKT
jgi:hypothetical protein